MKRVWCLLSVFLFIAGCAEVPMAERRGSAESGKLGPAGSETLSLTRILVRVPPGTQVGNEFTTTKKTKDAAPIYWKTNFFLSEQDFKLRAYEGLRRRGYSVVGAEEVLFERSAISSPRFLLGGVIVGLSHDKHGPKTGNDSSARVSVEWQLFDNERRKVVYSGETQGKARRPYDLSAASVLLAFDKALDALIARPEFVSLVAKRSSSVTPARPQTPTPSTSTLSTSKPSTSKPSTSFEFTPCQDARPISLPENMERVLEGIVVVKAGAVIGSGVILSADGIVLTAAHVVKGGGPLGLQMKSGLSLGAELLHFDEDYDLALLKMPGTGHACLPLGTGPPPAAGLDVYAIGTPAGMLDFSVSKGVISAVRQIHGLRLLQTDASVNSGNSGGPLLDKTGHVVGIVTWKLRPEQGYEGIAFAVPAQAIIQRLHLAF